jgi:hypothetical protein
MRVLHFPNNQNNGRPTCENTPFLPKEFHENIHPFSDANPHAVCLHLGSLDAIGGFG